MVLEQRGWGLYFSSVPLLKLPPLVPSLSLFSVFWKSNQISGMLWQSSVSFVPAETRDSLSGLFWFGFFFLVFFWFCFFVCVCVCLTADILPFTPQWLIYGEIKMFRFCISDNNESARQASLRLIRKRVLVIISQDRWGDKVFSISRAFVWLSRTIVL